MSAKKINRRIGSDKINQKSKVPSPTKRKKSMQPQRTSGDAMKRLANEMYTASCAVEKKLANYLDAIDFDTRRYVYTIKHRVKSAYAINQKVKRKRHKQKRGSDGWHYEPNHITDGCGFRIVTVFQTGILEIVRDLIALIKHEGEKSPFLKGRLKEAVIYTNRPINEENSIHVLAKQMIDDAQFVFEDKGYTAKIAKPENKKSGYSSIHLVAFVPVTSDRWLGETEIVHQTVEIQVRDIFEEAWGEVDHALRYVVEREQDGDVEKNPRVAQWKPHLNALKTFADGCSQHASLIKKNAIDAAAVTAGEEHLSVDTANQAITELQEILPLKFHTELRQAFDCRDDASRAVDNPVEVRELFDEAAKRFEKLIKKTHTYLSTILESTRTVGYRLEMELAYCLRYEDASEREQAITIYEGQLKAFPFDVTASYRLGMALRDGEQINASLTAFLTAGKNLDKDPTIKATDWINSAVLRNIGYSHWLLAECALKKDAPADFIKYMKKAITLTKEAVSRSEPVRDRTNEQRKGLNNITFFMMRVLQHDKNGIRKVASKAILKTYIASLENSMQSMDGRVDIFVLDTLAQAYNFIRNKSKRDEIQARVVKAIYEIAQRNAKDQTVTPSNLKTYLKKDLHDIVDDLANVLNLKP